MACKMKDDNKDIIGEKCVKDQEGNIAFNSEAKAWQTHYLNLLSMEFPCNHVNLPSKPAVYGPSILIH